jgi:hypothetical protein
MNCSSILGNISQQRVRTSVGLSVRNGTLLNLILYWIVTKIVKGAYRNPKVVLYSSVYTFFFKCFYYVELAIKGYFAVVVLNEFEMG